jgi:hypothetical protein
MNIYAYISIHTYFNRDPFNVGFYRLTNKDGIYYWKSIHFHESHSIKLVYQINIALSEECTYYGMRPDIAFNEKHLECPLIEREMLYAYN